MITKLTLEYWTDDGWYVGKIKEIPGVFSQGETIEELEKNINEAYKMMMEESDVQVPISDVKRKELEVEM